MSIAEIEFGPFEGYVASLQRHRVPANMLSADSRDWKFEPTERKWVRRLGMANIGGTAGILEAGGVATRARKFIELNLPDLTDKLPVHGVLYTSEPDATLYFYSSNDSGANVNRVLAKDSAYPADLKMPHMVQDTLGSTIWYHGATSAAQRYRICGGSWGMIQISDRIYFPNYYSLPSNWNKRFNSVAVTGKNERIFPTGHIPALRIPTVVLGPVSAGGSWNGNDNYYISVMGRRDSGEWGPPTKPRKVNANLTMARGLVTHGTAVTRHDYITISNIPILPDGYNARALLRTTKLQGAVPDAPLDLRLWEFIDNNIQTTITSSKGSDAELVADDQLIRVGADAREAIVWPDRARHIWVFDGRICVGDLQRNLGAIVLAPITDNAGVALNEDDDNATMLARNPYEFWVEWSGANVAINLNLRYNAGAATVIALAGKSVQDLVDLINMTTTASSSHQWAAELIPGADGSADSVGLMGSTSSDYRKAFNNAYPGILFMNANYIAKFSQRCRQFMHTTSSPGEAPFAPFQYLGGNKRALPDECGILVGGAALLDGCVILGSKKAALYRNLKGGRSGLDEDYFVSVMLNSSGCISPYSVVRGNGWVGYLTALGYVVNDGDREILISGAMWEALALEDDGSIGRGQWRYEIQQCIKATQINESNAASLVGIGVTSDESANFHAFVDPMGRLHVRYRSSSAVTYPDSRAVYDFSQGFENSGLAQVLRPDGQLYGWSTPLKEPLSVMGMVRKADGVRLYGTLEDPVGANGRVDQFEVGTLDASTSVVVTNCTTTLNQTNVTSTSSFSTVAVGASVTGTGIAGGTTVAAKISDSQITLSANATASGTVTLTFLGKEIEPVAYCGSWGITADQKAKLLSATTVSRKTTTGLTLTVSRDQNRTTQVAKTIRAVPTSSQIFRRQRILMDSDSRSPTDIFEFGFADDGSGSAPPSVSRITARVKILRPRK